jgi:hypothetical protein
LRRERQGRSLSSCAGAQQDEEREREKRVTHQLRGGRLVHLHVYLLLLFIIFLLELLVLFISFFLA